MSLAGIVGDIIGAATFERLKITSYDDDRKSNEILTWEAYYNPSSFTSTFLMNYATKKPEGSTGDTMKFSSQIPATFTFVLKLDGTGASAPYGSLLAGKLDVDQKIRDFLDVVYTVKGDVHRNSYLQISWGDTFTADVVLSALTITKSLFSPDGKTLRADLNCSFKEFSNEELAAAKGRKSSPDLTHVRVVQQGDRLPLMCERIYGDARLYLEIAKHNGLSNYRNLTPGQTIHFPPLIAAKT